ncbi:MAG: hypothetical protein AB7G93_07605 [Bdellovibrionales bacterium]
MKFWCLVNVLLLSSASFADSITCTLQSGEKTTSATLALESPQEDYAIADGLYDLSFSLTAECATTKCTAFMTIDSRRAQSEVGSTGFDFRRSGPAREIFREPLENAPDQRQYTLYCTYNP